MSPLRGNSDPADTPPTGEVDAQLPPMAYLVIREGNKWSDVFRLLRGRTVTLGRAATNQVVIKNERASRQHAEIFCSETGWVVRDLGSRNGTRVGDERIEGDHPLVPGDIIRIAQYQLAFVYDLNDAFGPGRAATFDSPNIVRGTRGTTDLSLSLEDLDDDDNLVIAEEDQPLITHRRGKTRFLSPPFASEGSVGLNRAATMLCRIAFELAQQRDALAVSQLALDGLFEGTPVEGGGVWLAVESDIPPRTLDELNLVASRSDSLPRYHFVTDFLARTVLSDGEAVLARNVSEDSDLGSTDSKGEILSTGVICAPIRLGSKVLGLIHVYSVSYDEELTVDDLEFTLAVAENVALALTKLARERDLAENLSQTKQEILQLRERLGVESELVGSSPRLAQVKREIARAAESKATVLIRGESGVGKELVARAIHFSGPRRNEPFVCLNCAALTETLLESELFGHEQGAFTGATKRKIGKFEAADRGTLMLDEIGEMSPTIQAKFLRVLEGHPFERVGGTKPIQVDVRVIAATNRDLEVAVGEGIFRRDLYFRLRVLEIKVPPLRKRPEDIRDLALYFLQRFRSETGRKLKGFTRQAMQRLLEYRWPGNVRELKNVIERAVVLCRADLIDLEDLALSHIPAAHESGELTPLEASFEPRSLAEMEKAHIAATLEMTGWNKSRSASILGIERSTLDRKIRKYRIERP